MFVIVFGFRFVVSDRGLVDGSIILYWLVGFGFFLLLLCLVLKSVAVHGPLGYLSGCLNRFYKPHARKPWLTVYRAQQV